MNLVFIHFGHYDGFGAVLECAAMHANCPIMVVSDQPKPKFAHHVPLSDFPNVLRIQKELANAVGAWASYSLARWFVLREVWFSVGRLSAGIGLENNPLLPVFCCDWDVMIFKDLEKAYEPFKDYDYTVSVEGGMESAAYGVNSFAALQAFCDLVLRDKADPTLNDMEAWSRLTRTGNWKVGNLFEIKNDSVFDHSITCGGDRFQMDGDCKKVTWKNGSPYFTRHDGSLVTANSIHCWGPFKSKPNELLKKVRA